METLAALQTILDDKVKETRIESLALENEPIKEIQELIFYIKFDLRTYAISTDHQVEKLWEFICSSERRLDFILELNTAFLFYIGREKWDALIEQYVHSTYSNNSLMDVDTKERLPDKNWLLLTLGDNDWLFIIFLLKITKIPTELLIDPRVRNGKERLS